MTTSQNRYIFHRKRVGICFFAEVVSKLLLHAFCRAWQIGLVSEIVITNTWPIASFLSYCFGSFLFVGILLVINSCVNVAHLCDPLQVQGVVELFCLFLSNDLVTDPLVAEARLTEFLPWEIVRIWTVANGRLEQAHLALSLGLSSLRHDKLLCLVVRFQRLKLAQEFCNFVSFCTDLILAVKVLCCLLATPLFIYWVWAMSWW